MLYFDQKLQNLPSVQFAVCMYLYVIQRIRGNGHTTTQKGTVSHLTCNLSGLRTLAKFLSVADTTRVAHSAKIGVVVDQKRGIAGKEG